MDPIKRKYVILRKKNTGPRDLTAGATIDTARNQNEISVDISEVDPSNTNTLRSDNTVVGFAPALPLKLITPTESNTPSNNDVQWGIQKVGADSTHVDGSDITVAVLDTGIDENHEAFANVPLEVKDFTGDGAGDQNGHGTHCAGTIFGADVGGKRIGVAQNIRKALIGKVLGQNGGDSASIIEAIHWALREGANVISMSLGIDFPGYVDFLVNSHGLTINAATSMALEEYRQNVDLFESMESVVQTQTAISQNPCLIIAASGNESNRPNYEIATAPPAVSSGILSVGAIDINSKVADFSNNKADVSAPGVNILSAKTGGGLQIMSGTSMATPHVAGVAALWAQELKQNGIFTASNLEAQLRATALRGFNGFNMTNYGAGIVQAPQQGIT